MGKMTTLRVSVSSCILATYLCSTNGFVLEITARDMVFGACLGPTAKSLVKGVLSGPCFTPEKTPDFISSTVGGANQEYILVKGGNYLESEPDGYKIFPHPDFQQGPDGKDGFGKINSRSLHYPDESGLGKPLYAKAYLPESYMSRLSNSLPSSNWTGSITWGQDAFHAWYNDVPRMNKRIGTTITLQPRDGSDFVFEFIEDRDTPEALFNHDPANNVSSELIGEGFFGPVDGFPFSFDPFEAGTVWPPATNEIQGGQQLSGKSVKYSLPHKFSFTTEIHTFFQYRLGDSFRFNGDDDIYIFVDGELAGEAPGKHGEAEVKVNMDSLGLTVGKFYALDVFHAERSTSRSNVDLTVTLSEGCSVVSSPLDTLDELVIGVNSTFLDLHKQGGLQLVGAKLDEASEGVLLTSKPNSWGHAWVKQQVNIGRGFDIVFQYKIEKNEVGKSGDGFALVLQNHGITDLQGGVAGYLGTRGIKAKSLVMALDYCTDRGSADPCSGFPELRLELNNTVLARAPAYMRLNDGKEHTIRVRYFASPDWIEVLHDNSLWLRATDIDLVSQMETRAAYVGFTSGTSFISGKHYITSLQVKTMGIAASNTLMESGIYDSTETDASLPVADGSAASTVTIRNFDNCKFPVRFGGFSDKISARLVEQNGTAWLYNAWQNWTIPTQGTRRLLAEGPDPSAGFYNYSQTPTIVPADIEDNGDGAYMVKFSPTVAAEYTLEIEFDGNPVCFNETSCSPFPNAMAFAEYIPPPSTARPTFEPVMGNQGLPEEAVLGIGVAGGIFGCCFLATTVLFYRYRKAWEENFGFASKGKLALLEKGVDYDENGQLSELAREFQKTREEINKLKSQTTGPNYDETIKKLEDQKNEIKENLRVLKRELQEKNVDPGAMRRAIISVRRRSNWQPSRASRAISGRFSIRKSSTNSRDSAADKSLGPMVPLKDEPEEFSFSRPNIHSVDLDV